MSDEFDKVASIGRLPDGRWAVRRERDLSDLTHDDLRGIVDAFKFWAGSAYEHDAAGRLTAFLMGLALG